MRTPARNWKYGQTDVNVLLLAVIWRGVAIPLLYELLPHGGGSHTEIRHTLMDDALCLLSAADIRVLYADREFVGYDWIQGLACRGIPICVRLRSDTLMDDWTAKDWLIRTPIEWAAKPVQSERMRVGEKRVPDVELTDRWCSDLLTKQTESV